jgi:hypothetical protein
MGAQRQISRIRRLSFLALCVGVAALAFAAASASARQAATHSFLASFAPTFGSSVADISVDEETGYVYLISEVAGNPVSKFTASGTPAAFTDPAVQGASTFSSTSGPAGAPLIAIDNSGTSTQGRIYAGTGSSIAAFEPSGHRIDSLQIGGRDFAVDPSSGNLWVVSGRFEENSIVEYTSNGVATGATIALPPESANPSSWQRVDVDSNGDVYLWSVITNSIRKYDPTGRLLASVPYQFIGDIAVDPSENDVYASVADTFGGAFAVKHFNSTISQITQFGTIERGGISLDVNGSTGNVYVAHGGSSEVFGTVKIYGPGPAITVPDATTLQPSDLTPTSVTLNGTVNPDGTPTSDCQFEWGVSTSYGNSVPCAEGQVLTGSGAQPVSAELTGLVKGKTYNYRVVATNSNAAIAGLNISFTPSEVPDLDEEFVSDVHSDSVILHADVDPEGAETNYHFEYGTAPCSASSCTSTPGEIAPLGVGPQSKSFKIIGLQPGTTYHYRVVADNQSGPSVGVDRAFTTFPLVDLLSDPCPNAHVRQQTGAALLLDCRAYELVSAADAGGYDVESSLVPGQTPFGGYPRVGDTAKALYGIHNGAIPGVGVPTNRGVDPYVATRGKDGWDTEYVGIPSDNPFAGGPFSSSLLEASSMLDSFAFGGGEVCNPCFADGSTNIPLRLPDGALVQGMAGSESPGPANPSGYVGKHFSADGEHFVFGTATQLEPAGQSNGDVSIYDRDLKAGTTQVVSTLPNGQTMSGAGIGSLDISADGSRIVVAQKVSTDAAGNSYWHPYLHIGTSPNTVDLAPGAITGVLFAGMTEDGAKIFFTTKDELDAADTDTSADLYEAAVDSGGSLSLKLLSTGATPPAGDTDSCDPAPTEGANNWNAVGAASANDCGVLAIAGGGGVASEEGSVYFFSPEKLDGSGVQNQPNLFLVRPGGSPELVTTIDSTIAKPARLPGHPIADPDLIGGLVSPVGLAIDQSNGSIYVVDRREGGRVSRYTSAGAPLNFTAGPGAGSNKITQSSLVGGNPQQTGIAVDNAPGSPLSGAFYIKGTDTLGVYASSGEKLGELNLGSQFTCGFAVDQASGALYVADHNQGTIKRFMPATAVPPIDNSDYTVTTLAPFLEGRGMSPCNIGVDKAGHVFASDYFSHELASYQASDFLPLTGEKDGLPLGMTVQAVTTDPASNDLYADEGTQLVRFDSSGKPLQKFGSEVLVGSRGVAINAATQHVYATSGTSVVEFGVDSFLPERIDNPAVIHAIEDSETHHYGDFQVTPDGEFAAFSSLLSLTGFDNNPIGLHPEVFRYESSTQTIACASCNPTGARAVGDSELAPDGLGLADDGRLFFSSADPLAPRDLNEKYDAYEYSDGKVELVSTGVSPFDSRLLGISADATDAYFFTHDVLVAQDKNGERVKVYDARAGGGFEYFPPLVPCKASDECHGPGTEAPGPPEIRTIEGSSGNHVANTKKKLRCKRGRVKRRGRCVKSSKQRRPNHHVDRRNG